MVRVQMEKVKASSLAVFLLGVVCSEITIPVLAFSPVHNYFSRSHLLSAASTFTTSRYSTKSSILSAFSTFDISTTPTIEEKEKIATTENISSIVNSNNEYQTSCDLNWSFVDKIYLITCPNADPESKRLNKARDILTIVGLWNRVEVKEFDTDDDDRIRGCYTSHISVIRDAMENYRIRKRKRGHDSGTNDWLQQVFSIFGDGQNQSQNDSDLKQPIPDFLSQEQNVGLKILVLEDNLEYNGSLNKEGLESIASFVNNNDEVDMVHLAYIPYVPNLKVTKTDNRNIVKLSCGIGSALGTTSYIINESAMEALLQRDSEKGYYAAIPDVMAELFPESRYAAYPTPFLRAPKTSSLVNPQLDDLRSLLFQPWIVSCFQNVLAMTEATSNNLFFGTIGALVAVSAVAGKITLDAVHEILTFGTYDGNWVLPLISSIFSLFSLLILAQGAILAPKPPQEEEEGDSNLGSDGEETDLTVFAP